MTKYEAVFAMNHPMLGYGAVQSLLLDNIFNYGSLHGLNLIASLVKVLLGFNLDGQFGGYDYNKFATL